MPAVAGAWALAAALWADEPAALSTGCIVDPVPCLADSEQSYALYLPPGYDPERRWPVLYCWDPAAQGRRGVERFQAAAEQHGWILVGSNNARNGSWERITEAVNAVLADTTRRLALDPTRRYAAGFSGGARTACSLAEQLGFAGVVVCGGGFPESRVPSAVEFAVFAAAGGDDFNYLEVRNLARAIADQHGRVRLAIFDGGHEWLPASLAAEALDWLDLMAMRSGRLPRDDAWIARSFAERQRRLASLTGLEAYRGNLELAADFEGLADTSAASRTAAALKDTKPVRTGLAAERKAARQEEEWTQALLGAIEHARHPPPRVDPFLQIERQGAGGAGDVGRGGMNSDASGASPPSWPAQSMLIDDSDRFSELRSVVHTVERKAKANPAARRALNRAYAVVEKARWLLENGDPTSAAIYLEAATLVRPDAATAYFLWARAAAAQQDRRRGRELLQEAQARGFKDAAAIARLEAELK